MLHIEKDNPTRSYNEAGCKKQGTPNIPSQKNFVSDPGLGLMELWETTQSAFHVSALHALC